MGPSLQRGERNAELVERDRTVTAGVGLAEDLGEALPLHDEERELVECQRPGGVEVRDALDLSRKVRSARDRTKRTIPIRVRSGFLESKENHEKLLHRSSKRPKIQDGAAEKPRRRHSFKIQELSLENLKILKISTFSKISV